MVALHLTSHSRLCALDCPVRRRYQREETTVTLKKTPSVAGQQWRHTTVSSAVAAAAAAAIGGLASLIVGTLPQAAIRQVPPFQLKQEQGMLPGHNLAVTGAQRHVWVGTH